ncbi:MAG TPA: class I SAM-dependent methyltransferase [Candidatus Dormibacteraeota bacterium]|jgi:ubiquinone/menaquinone biosynthesis C-methylase UbiE|nr:class I SAM-dependent methyltransferase [Verrucomicrobiae bacterium]HXJ75727.1 class I SAM-dependent methyltransferase [Candidatus Dormibacteraeota bacterium]
MKTSSWFWDCYAQCYDGLLSIVPYQRLLNRVQTAVPPGARTLLDAGCGTGNLLQAMRRADSALRLHGVDFSEIMLRRAKTKIPDAVLLKGDLNGRLPFPDGSFDVVTCINVLYAVTHPERTLTELRRVLTRGGTLMVSSPLARPRLSAFLREHASVAGWWRTLPLAGRLWALVLINAVIFRRGRRGQYHFLDLRTVQKLFVPATIDRAYADQNWFACAIKQ